MFVSFKNRRKLRRYGNVLFTHTHTHTHTRFNSLAYRAVGLLLEVKQKRKEHQCAFQNVIKFSSNKINPSFAIATVADGDAQCFTPPVNFLVSSTYPWILTVCVCVYVFVCDDRKF